MNAPLEVKEQIKRNSLGTLASNFKHARKGAAQIVSAIACIEIPRNEWSDIINVLVANANGEILNYKLISLETLGYIFEELPEGSLTGAQVDLALSAIIINLLPHIQSDEIKLTALTALTGCIKFSEKNFKTEIERNTIISNVLACCSVTSQSIRMKSMQCMLEIVRYFYDFIGSALEGIATTTFGNIRADESEEVALIAIEIWSAICDEEIQRLDNCNKECKNYIRVAYNCLMKVLLECLSRQPTNGENDFFMDENDWNLPVASICCISLIAMIIKDPIVDYVLKYVAANINSENWQLRKAALLSFVSILKGPQKETINTLIIQALPTLLNLLNDKNKHVRETTAWTFATILETNSEPIFNPKVLNDLLSILLVLLKDVPKVSNKVCYTLHHLAIESKPSDSDNSCPLSMYFKDILTALWENAFRSDGLNDGVNLGNASFAAFCDLITNSAPDVELNINAVLQLVAKEFTDSLQPFYRMVSRVSEYREYLCSIMQASFLKLMGKVYPTFAGSVLEAIIESFKQQRTVYEEGLLAISSLITSIGIEFKPYMKQLEPYLIHALQKIDEPDVCRVATSCIGDISRALEEETKNYLQEIIPIFMKHLNNTETERGLKLVIIVTLSDLAMATNKYFLLYLKDVLEILKSACNLSLNPPEDDDPELPAYIQNLKESLIDAYTGIVYSLKIAQDTTVMDGSVIDLFHYIQSIYTETAKINIDFLKSIVGLVGDVASLYQSKVKDLLSQSFIQKMVADLEKVDSEECRTTALWAKTSIAKATK